jgi:hypothetical protein
MVKMTYYEWFRRIQISYTMTKCKKCRRIYINSKEDWTMSTENEREHSHYDKTEQNRRDRILMEENPNKGMYIP